MSNRITPVPVVVGSEIILGVTGSLAAPSYSFAVDPNTGMFRTGADALRFAAGGVEGLKLTEVGGVVTAKFPDPIDASAGGIHLGGTVDAAHLLDDYEEGTFTPTLQDSSFSDAEGQTYGLQLGTYVKVGNTVFFTFHMRLSSLGTMTTSNASNIAGLPFAMANNFSTCHLGQAVGLNLTGAFAVAGRLDSATDTIRLMAMSSAAGHSSVTIAQFSANGEIKMSGHYVTNA